MFTYNKYEIGLPLGERKAYVLVEFSVSPEGLGGVKGEPARRVLQPMVENGLRVTLGYQGLTGLGYLDLDLVADPEQYPGPEFGWQPQKHYIPSYPSTVAQVSESLQSIMTTVREIEDVPFGDIGQGVDDLLQQLNDLESDEELARGMQQALRLLEDSERVVARLRSLLETEGVDDIPADAAAATARARKLMEQAEQEVPALLKNARETSELLHKSAERMDKLLQDERIDRGLEDAAAAARDLEQATEQLPDTARELRRTLKETAEVVGRQGDDLHALMRELHEISRNLKRLSEQISRQPSRLLFSDPPPRWEEMTE
jgi:methyl-accepting chemotaxis protein